MIFSKQDAGYSSRLGPRSNFLSIVSVGGERWVSVGGGGCPGPRCSGADVCWYARVVGVFTVARVTSVNRYYTKRRSEGG